MSLKLDLKNHIVTDPDARGYSGMSDAQVADDLNVKRRPSSKTLTFESMLSTNDAKTHKWFESLETAGGLSSATLASAPSCKALYNLMINGGSMDANDSEIQELSNDMAGAGEVATWDATDHTAFVNFAANLQSDGEYYGFGFVKEGLVTAARGA